MVVYVYHKAEGRIESGIITAVYPEVEVAFGAWFAHVSRAWTRHSVPVFECRPWADSAALRRRRHHPLAVAGRPWVLSTYDPRQEVATRNYAYLMYLTPGLRLG